MENLGFWLDNCQGNWKANEQEDLMERNPIKVGVTLVLVPLKSNHTVDVKQPKDLENC